MEKLILLILIFPSLFKVMIAQLCPTYSMTTTLSQDQCYQVSRNGNSTTIQFQSCSDQSTFCNISNINLLTSQTYSCGKTTYKYSWPIDVDGEPCTSNQGCYSNNCVDGFCVGFTSGSFCNSTRQCQTGYFCNSNKLCESQKSNGTKCVLDEECVNGHGCYSGSCLKYFTLDDGKPVIQGKEKFYCANAYQSNGLCDSTTLNATTPFNCTSDCSYKISSGDILNITGTCNCGINSLGKKYCQQGTTSNTFQKYKSALQDAYKVNCHVSKQLNCYKFVTVKSKIFMKILVYANLTYQGLLNEQELNYAHFFSDSKFSSFGFCLLFMLFFLII